MAFATGFTRLSPGGWPTSRDGNYTFKQPGLTDIIAQLKSVEIDVTPPHPISEPIELQRWLHENLARVQVITSVLDEGEGVDSVFLTNDGKTVTVVHGVITGIS